LVTDGISAIGQAVVERLTKAGLNVAFSGRDDDVGNEVSSVTGATFVPGDPDNEAAVACIVTEAQERLHGLDSLVVAERAHVRARISDTKDTDWDSVFDGNVVIPFLFAKASIPVIARSGGGAVVVVVSGTALWTEQELGAYSASMRALLWMSHMLSVECADRGITVNAVCSGDMAVDGRVPSLSAKPPLPPLGRYTEPQDIAGAVKFFIGSDARFCSGASLVVDGGIRSSLRAHKVRA